MIYANKLNAIPVHTSFRNQNNATNIATNAMTQRKIKRERSAGENPGSDNDVSPSSMATNNNDRPHQGDNRPSGSDGQRPGANNGQPFAATGNVPCTIAETISTSYTNAGLQ